MTCVTNGQTEGLCPSYGFNTATNQISGFTYDAAGNLLSDGTHSYTWDGEGRLATVDGGASANITYNVWGEKVENQGVTSFYNAAGQRVFDAGYNFVPWGEVALVVFVIGENTFFVHHNALPSTTDVTDQAGALAQDSIFYPWGQDWIDWMGPYGWTDDTFATLVPLVVARGEETTTALNRNYSKSYGRWLSPDPRGGDVSNPQSLNRYAYVLNNPTTLTDPSGLAAQDCTKAPDPRACWQQTYWGLAGFPLDMLEPFSPNGWDEFSLLNVPLVSTDWSYVPIQPISTPIDTINNEWGEAISSVIFAGMGWAFATLGNGFVILSGPLGGNYSPFQPPLGTPTIQAQPRQPPGQPLTPLEIASCGMERDNYQDKSTEGGPGNPPIQHGYEPQTAFYFTPGWSKTQPPTNPAQMTDPEAAEPYNAAAFGLTYLNNAAVCRDQKVQ